MTGHVFRRCTTCGRRFDTDDHQLACPGVRFSLAYRVDVATATSNGRTQRRGGGFTSKKAAERAMREILAKVDNASYVPTSERTVDHFLEVEWLPIQVPPAAGGPSIRLHDVRHTDASLLLASGEHLKVVQERLGWTTASFMLDTYTHLLPGMQAEAAERFAKSILPATRVEESS